MIGAYSFVGINPWAVLVSAIAAMVIGFLWYSPILFANPWMRLMGIDTNDKAKIAEMRKRQNLRPRARIRRQHRVGRSAREDH
jgi:hypothetical protein